MVRLTMLLLCLLLAAAAAGRYQAEIAVRESRKEIESLKAKRATQLQQIQTLRAEIAYLENPERLAILASKLTDLKPVSASQLMSASEFRVAFSSEADIPLEQAEEAPSGRMALAQISIPGAAR